ncbi:MAG: IS1595 family transposase [Acidimicrobiales bacterium]|jgi:transposase-like protein
MDLMRDFPDDATCLAYLWERHYATVDAEHAHCPKCGEVRKFHRVASRPSYSCDVCGHHIHPTANTIMHKSSTSLQLWFHAIFLMAQTRMGISAKQLERELGVTYKTAWRMFTKIRNELMVDDDTVLVGSVEADETYVGGKPRGAPPNNSRHDGDGRHRGRGGRSRDQKQPVFGMVERGGRARAYPIPDASAANLVGGLRKHVAAGTTVYTDTYLGYHPMKHEMFDHRQINHRDGSYVVGDIHTNTIEGFWSIVKNGIRGSHRHVSKKWLQGYLNEYVWRYSHRDDTHPMFLSLLEHVSLSGPFAY